MFGYQGGNFQVRIHCKYCTALQQLTYTSSTLHSSVKIKRKAESRALVLPVPFSTHSRGQTIQEHETEVTACQAPHHLLAAHTTNQSLPAHSGSP